MSETDTFSCSSCGTRFRRGSLAQGARVKCRNCGTTITVPPDEFEALEDVLETHAEAAGEAAPAARSSAARARGGKAGRGGRTARSGSAARPGQSERDKKAPVMLFASLGAMALIAGGIWFFTSGNSKPTNSTSTGEQSSTVTDASKQTSGDKPAEKTKTPRERFDEALRAAEASGDSATKVEHLRDALALAESASLGDGASSPEKIHELIVAADPDNKESRLALGYKLYGGKHPDYAGKWVTDADYTRITTEWQKLERERELKEAAAADAARWETPFGKKAKRVADYYRNDVKDVPGLDLRFYFATEKIPHPYLLMVEEAQSPDPTATAELIGPGLSALRKQFRAAYADATLPSWDDAEFVVPVMVFKDQKSYENYRDHGHKFFPSTGLAAAFYTSSVDEGIADFCRGTLYVWQGASESQFYHELFHEATHQIMHNAAQLPRMPPTPWLQEGIAEFWGAYEGNQYSGYKFRRALKGRQGTISSATDAYFAWKAQQKEGKGAEDGDANAKNAKTFLTPKEFLGIDQIRFARAKNAIENEKATPEDQLIVSTVYALGWAWIFYSHVGPSKASLGEPGKWTKAFEDVLGLELRYRYNRDRLAEAYDIKSDEDWDKITDDFFLFCARKLRRYMSGDLDIPEMK